MGLALAADLASAPAPRSLCLALFVRHCLRVANPFIEPALFRVRPFTGAALVMAPYSIAFGAMLFSDRGVGADRVGLVGAADRPGDRAGAAAGPDHLAAARRDG